MTGEAELFAWVTSAGLLGFGAGVLVGLKFLRHWRWETCRACEGLGLVRPKGDELCDE